MPSVRPRALLLEMLLSALGPSLSFLVSCGGLLVVLGWSAADGGWWRGVSVGGVLKG